MPRPRATQTATPPLLHLAAAVIGLACCSPGPGAAPPGPTGYRAKVIPVPLGWLAADAGFPFIDEDGCVLFTRTRPGDGGLWAPPHPFRWCHGELTDLSRSVGRAFAAGRPNRSHEVPGDAWRTPGQPAPEQACVWREARLEMLPGPPGWQRHAGRAMNDQGVVVGSCMGDQGDGFHERPCLWRTRGRVAPLWQFLPTGGYTNGEAVDVNARGDAVGWTGAQPEDRHATLWRGGKPLLLDHYDRSSKATAINDRGEVALWVLPNGRSSGEAGWSCIWRGGRLHRLPGLPGSYGAVVADINSRGDAVGFTHASVSRDRPVLWRGGAAIDVGGYVPARSGLVLYTADSINDRGQILCSGARGGEDVYVVLTPARRAGGRRETGKRRACR